MKNESNQSNSKYRPTLYVSSGITDTWSNHITPFVVVVN